MLDCIIFMGTFFGANAKYRKPNEYIKPVFDSYYFGIIEQAISCHQSADSTKALSKLLS